MMNSAVSAKFFLLLAAVFNLQLMQAQQGAAANPNLLWALSHPMASVKVNSIYKKQQFIYKKEELKMVLDSFGDCGKLDAFRHVYFMAAFAQKIKVKKLRRLGIAHEEENYREFLKGEADAEFRHDSLSMVMDLYNNELGFQTGLAFPELEPEALKMKVIEKIQAGEALIAKRNLQGTFLDCEGNRLSMKDYSGKWFVPKCLIRSDYIYKD